MFKRFFCVCSTIPKSNFTAQISLFQHPKWIDDKTASVSSATQRLCLRAVGEPLGVRAPTFVPFDYEGYVASATFLIWGSIRVANYAPWSPADLHTTCGILPNEQTYNYFDKQRNKRPENSREWQTVHRTVIQHRLCSSPYPQAKKEKPH